MPSEQVALVLQVTDKVVAQIVAEAPAAELASGDADVSTTGQRLR